MRDFPRPAPVEVEIFGEKHALKRLTYADVFELLGEVAQTLQGKQPEAQTVLVMFSAGGPMVDDLLRRSFPTFEEWSALPIDAWTGLLGAIIEENNVAGILENFTKLRERLAAQSRKV